MEIFISTAPSFMKIIELTLKDFKAQNVVQPLTGRDIFIGPNGSGKSSRIDSLAISLLGYCPKKGKTLADTFKYAVGNEMVVGMALDTGFKFTRSLIKKTKTNVKNGATEVKINQSYTMEPSKGEKTDTQKAARITEECGNFPMMLDFNEFLQLSDTKRREFIYNLSPFTSQKGKADVENHLRKELLNDELEASNTEAYNIMEQLIKDCLKQYPEGVSIQDGLSLQLDWAKSQQSSWNEEKKKAESAVQKLADIKNQLKETDRNIAINKEEMEKFQESLVRSEATLAADTEKKKANVRRAERIGQITGLIQSVHEKFNSLQPNTDDIDARIKEMQATIASVDFRPEIDQHIKKQQQLNSLLNNVMAKKQGLYKTKGELEGQIKTLTVTVNNVKGIKTVTDPQSHEKVNVCVMHHLIKCTKDFTPFLGHMEKQLAEAHSALQLKSVELASIEEKEAEINSQLQLIQQEIAKVNARTAETGKSNENARTTINNLERQKNKLITQRQGLEKELTLYKDELNRLQSEPPEEITPSEILEKQVAGLRFNINSLKQKISDQEQAKTTLANLRSSMVDGKDANIKYECCKMLADALGPKGLQGQLVAEVLNPIQEEIQDNLGLMGIENKFYFQTKSDTGKEVFQFGWINDKGHYVNFDVLSTGQQMTLLIAIMVTLLDRANPPLKVLSIDDIEHLHPEKNFYDVISGLNAISHKLDNIILSGARYVDPTKLPGWKVWDLGNIETTEVIQESFFGGMNNGTGDAAVA